MPKAIVAKPKDRQALYHANTLERSLGLEIELASIGDMRQAYPKNRIDWKGGSISWNWVHDGSITQGGEEMVLNPLVGDLYVGGMARLTVALLTHSAMVDQSCGLHVHVGAREDIGMWQLRNVFLGYLRVQKDVYKLVSPERIESRFCRLFNPSEETVARLEQLTEAHELKEFFFKTLYGKKVIAKRGLHDDQQWVEGQERPLSSMWEVKNHKYQDCRYFGLNFHSWMQRGTIEWRHCQGTLDPERLMFWPLFCGWAVEILQGLREDERRCVNGLSDLVNGEWKRPFKTVKFPAGVRDWVLKTLKEAEEGRRK